MSGGVGSGFSGGGVVVEDPVGGRDSCMRCFVSPRRKCGLGVAK